MNYICQPVLIETSQLDNSLHTLSVHLHLPTWSVTSQVLCPCGYLHQTVAWDYMNKALHAVTVANRDICTLLPPN